MNEQKKPFHTFRQEKKAKTSTFSSFFFREWITQRTKCQGAAVRLRSRSTFTTFNPPRKSLENEKTFFYTTQLSQYLFFFFYSVYMYTLFERYSVSFGNFLLFLLLRRRRRLCPINNKNSVENSDSNSTETDRWFLKEWKCHYKSCSERPFIVFGWANTRVTGATDSLVKSCRHRLASPLILSRSSARNKRHFGTSPPPPPPFSQYLSRQRWRR